MRIKDTILETNKTLMNKVRMRTLERKFRLCRYCKLHKGENQREHAHHGSKVPKYKTIRVKEY